MGRIANTILTSGQAYGQGQKQPMVDIDYGGMFGFAPDLKQLVSNQQYVRQNVIALVVEPPKGFEQLPNPDKWFSGLRSLIELQTLSIDGLNGTLEVQTAETPVGGGGQMQQDPTNVTEARSNVTMRWPEKYGRVIGQYLEGWIRNLIMDPHSKYPAIINMQNRPADMLMDMYAMSVMFIEPDPTHQFVTKAWLGTNMYPLTSGDNTARKDQTQDKEVVVYDVAFAGVYQRSDGVTAFAQQLLDQISVAGANPHQRPSFLDALSANITKGTSSYENSVEKLGSEAVRT